MTIVQVVVLLEEEIQARRELQKKMVGEPYSRMLDRQIEKLYAAKSILEGKHTRREVKNG